MSSFQAPSKHPVTGKIEDAIWMDDYFGSHKYGVLFADGRIFRGEECGSEMTPQGIKARDCVE